MGGGGGRLWEGQGVGSGMGVGSCVGIPGDGREGGAGGGPMPSGHRETTSLCAPAGCMVV